MSYTLRFCVWESNAFLCQPVNLSLIRLLIIIDYFNVGIKCSLQPKLEVEQFTNTYWFFI